MSEGVLLDTCALIWTINESKLTDTALSDIQSNAEAGTLFVNPISAWEIGLLVAKNRLSLPLSVEKWFARIKTNPGFRFAELSTDILIRATRLPGSPPNDPMDRMMIAMARENGFQLMTRDRQIIAYADMGYVRVIRC